jgi:U6 snRNA-associated Sm-like protein LSm8
MDEGVEEVPLGLYLVKGDMMCVHIVPVYPAACSPTFPAINSILIGEIDEEHDRTIDLSTIRADPIPPIRY